ncbi:hypothetical protein [Cellulosimicrobium marinum]|uniref:hypothetical protein n=1 Tax=Cellulosimicrobium marinum TaxID=1638992 RepID=UPI001E4E985B|nr:hypothetical protein [Cellulosimicrobium marinum]MCB7136024.1 hypothetical protein [Cellulosimicrobium marinum]
MADVPFEALTGNPDEVRASVAAYARVREALAVACDELAPVRDALASQRGTAVTLAVGRVDDAVARARAHGALLDAAGLALAGFADDLALRQGDADAAVARRCAALAEMDRWVTAEGVARLDASGDPFGAVDPDAAARVQRARANAEAAREDVRRAEDDWWRACDAKRAAAVAAAARVEPLLDVAAVGAWVAAGGLLASFQSSGATALAAARLVDAVADRSVRGPARDAATAELAALVEAAGDDPAFWDVLMDRTAPADLYVLLGEGGTLATDGQVLDATTPEGRVAVAVRDALGPWTASLTADEQEEWGRRVVDDLGVDTIPTGWAATAALLLAAPRVAPGVHLGAVTRLEEVRRDVGRSPDVLATLPYERDTRDLTVVALDGLAASPELSWRYLSGEGDDALGAARSATWFGTAQAFGWADDGAAVTDVLRSAVLHGEQDATAQAGAALVLSRAASDLPDGLLAGTLSGQAREHLTDAFVPYVDAFDVNVNRMDDFTAVGTYTVAAEAPDAVFPGVGGRTLPLLDPQDVARVLAVTTSDDTGVARWEHALVAHHDAALGAVLAPGGAVRSRGDAASVADAFARAHAAAMSDAGFVAGAVERAALESAEKEHARYATRVTALMGAAGLLARTTGQAVVTTPLLSVAGSYLVSLDGTVRVAVDAAAAEGHAEQLVLAARGHDLLLAALVEDGVDPAEAERLAAASTSLDDGASRAAFTASFKEASGLSRPTSEATG